MFDKIQMILMMKTSISNNRILRFGDTGVTGDRFCVTKRKKGDKGKKEKVSKQKVSKGCHQGQNIIILAILERLKFEKFFWPTILFSVA